MTDTLDDLQAERQRIIAALIDNDRAIRRTLHPGPPRPDCTACDGSGIVTRHGGAIGCSCTARDPRGGRYGRAPVKGDAR